MRLESEPGMRLESELGMRLESELGMRLESELRIGPRAGGMGLESVIMVGLKLELFRDPWL
jgi:hypothetical protein